MSDHARKTELGDAAADPGIAPKCSCWIGRGDYGGWAPDRIACAVHGDEALAAAKLAAPGIAPREPLENVSPIEQMVRALKLAESVYRQNCVAPGEPSSLLAELQRVIGLAGEAEEEIRTLRRDSEILRRCNIVEIAVANDTGSVSDYMEHWEGRALKAEADVAKLLDETRLLRDKIQFGIRDAEQLSADNATLRSTLIALRDRLREPLTGHDPYTMTTINQTRYAIADALTQAAGLPA